MSLMGLDCLFDSLLVVTVPSACEDLGLLCEWHREQFSI
jgi:hypothetical protein